ncbi:hypothetical protein Phi13:2_gp054 [Cellulophaga phage phi13:2]|uniref:Uncharacterized protein n=2 Tax=Baltivirus TaxID=2946816 RepID=S0A278_9CAUD|nr:hypothetical protein Phi18:3_gp050 [Cellulophaga phage phi18:3]YP_008242079.1 hypothetical protein Phi13:2_gp054 [Cellulophaga phage phi13:2]AGO48562.1 hypothetical protein Phi18:3_gp050 [Cellulophaga phage phi18:3]AGO49664.1 hypothetical protein Phi13:2_gp054 [Cellulophaga phage phi13:2]
MNDYLKFAEYLESLDCPVNEFTFEEAILLKADIDKIIIDRFNSTR